MTHQNLFNYCLLIFLFCFLTFPVLGDDTQSMSKDSLNQLLPNNIGTEWKAITSFRKMTAEQISAHPNSKVFTEYGLQAITSRQYTNGKEKLTIEMFEMKYSSGAYGLWTFHRQTLPQEQKEFFNDRYLIRVSASNSTIANLIAAELQQNIPPTSNTPLLPTYLPDQSKITGSEIYLVGPEATAKISALSDLQEVIDFTGGTHVATADYNNSEGKMSIVLIEFQSPQFATDGLAKIQQHLNSLPPHEQKKRLLRRVGNYAVEAINVSDPKAAEELLGQIKYMARVHWEGKGISSIPLQFRPPDPIAIQEAVQTGRFIVAAFYWIGVLVLGAIFTGVFAGGAYFYWRHAQRRKWGLDEEFSDAGGMTRLNLDNCLFTKSTTPQKLLRENK